MTKRKRNRTPKAKRVSALVHLENWQFLERLQAASGDNLSDALNLCICKAREDLDRFEVAHANCDHLNGYCRPHTAELVYEVTEGCTDEPPDNPLLYGDEPPTRH